MRLVISYRRYRDARRLVADNFRAARLDALQVEVFRAFVEALPAQSDRSGERR